MAKAQLGEGYWLAGEEKKARQTLEEGLEANEMDLPVVGLTEMIAAHLEDRPN